MKRNDRKQENQAVNRKTIEKAKISTWNNISRKTNKTEGKIMKLEKKYKRKKKDSNTNLKWKL